MKKVRYTHCQNYATLGTPVVWNIGFEFIAISNDNKIPSTRQQFSYVAINMATLKYDDLEEISSKTRPMLTLIDGSQYSRGLAPSKSRIFEKGCSVLDFYCYEAQISNLALVTCAFFYACTG